MNERVAIAQCTGLRVKLNPRLMAGVRGAQIMMLRGFNPTILWSR